MKATQATTEQRTTEVLKLRVAGAEFDDIRQYASEKQWNVSDRQLWRYVAKSDEALTAAVEKHRGKLLARHLAQRRLLYAKALETGDWRGALAALKDEATLLRLYDPPPPAVPTVAPPTTAREVAELLAAVLSEARAGTVDGAAAAKLVPLADGLLRAFGARDTEERLAGSERS